MDQYNRDLLAGMYVSIISTYVLWKLHLAELMPFSDALSGVLEGLDNSCDVGEFIDDVILQLEQENSPLEVLTGQQRLLIFSTLNSVKDAVNSHFEVTDYPDEPFEEFASQMGRIPFDSENPKLGKSALNDKSFVMFAEDEETVVNNMTDEELRASIKDLFD